MVPLIATAETFSWYSVLSTSNFGHVIEESLWGLTAVLLVANLLINQRRLALSVRPFLQALCLIGVGYVLFMFFVDVPMYWSRWVSDELSGRTYLSLSEGFEDASGRLIVSHHWNDWKSEFAWMTLYFSAAVWLSIALVHAPILQRHTGDPRSADALSSGAVTNLAQAPLRLKAAQRPNPGQPAQRPFRFLRR